MHPASYFQLEYTFDFFNYAGIHRPVILYSVPAAVTIEDVKVETAVSEDLSSGTVSYQVSVNSDDQDIDCSVRLLDSDGAVVTSSTSKP